MAPELIITECRRRGIDFWRDGSGFKCSAPAGVMTRELQDLINSHRGAIRDYLVTESESDAAEWPSESENKLSSTVVTSTGWDTNVAAAADFILLLLPSDLPPTPFSFGTGRTVLNRDKFLRSIQADIRCGVDGPRSLLGTLQEDLLTLLDVVVRQITHSSN